MEAGEGELQRAWQNLQASIDACPVCHSMTCFTGTRARPPARPLPPIRSGGMLLIAEAPPPDGGFWNPEADDDLRRILLGLLPQGSEALMLFVAAGFSLIHTFKWPLGKADGTRTNYNGSRQQKQALMHTLTHLADEIRALKPVGILAMGNAAWHAAVALTEGTDEYPLKVQTAQSRKPQDYRIGLTQIPLNVTLLPVSRNMMQRGKREAIVNDVREFGKRHNWQPWRSHAEDRVLAWGGILP